MKILKTIGWTLLGMFMYIVCMDVFGGYEEWHSAFINLAAVVIIIALGIFVWVRHVNSGEADELAQQVEDAADKDADGDLPELSAERRQAQGLPMDDDGSDESAQKYINNS